MRTLIFTIFFLSITSVCAQSIDQNKINKNLRCIVCQGQSVADSNSEFAQTIKLVVSDLIDKGKSEDEIYSFLADKYGDWILYKPQINQQNLILLSLPYIILIAGGLIIFLLIRKRGKNV